MLKDFELAGGSVPGSDHVEAAKNCHDAYHFVQTDEASVAVVADGCGSGKHSEVGAKLGVRLIAGAILAELRTGRGEGPFSWERVRMSVLKSLFDLVKEIDSEKGKFIIDHLYFTAVGMLILPETSAAFAIGDGLIYVNGERIDLGPFPNNEPPYLAFALGTSAIDPELLKFQIVRSIPTEELQSFAVGTDGLCFLTDAEDECFPGTNQPIGPISQIWTEDRFFKNKDNARRLLARANDEKRRIDWDRRAIDVSPGLLKDDTAFVSGRRKRQEVTS